MNKRAANHLAIVAMLVSGLAFPRLAAAQWSSPEEEIASFHRWFETIPVDDGPRFRDTPPVRFTWDAVLDPATNATVSYVGPGQDQGGSGGCWLMSEVHCLQILAAVERYTADPGLDPTGSIIERGLFLDPMGWWDCAALDHGEWSVIPPDRIGAYPPSPSP